MPVVRYVVVYDGSIWGVGETEREAMELAHRESQRFSESNESLLEDPVITGGHVIKMECQSLSAIMSLT